jgi:hypothetical protein
MILLESTSRMRGPKAVAISAKSAEMPSRLSFADFGDFARRFRPGLGQLPRGPPTLRKGLATAIACDPFVDETANSEVLRVVAGAPLTVTAVSSVTALSALSSTVQRDRRVKTITTVTDVVAGNPTPTGGP